jgi:adenylosuccinate synthase
VPDREGGIRELVVVGCQFGDEGKGKVTDVLAGVADLVVRYQGGPHTGHTVHVGERTYKFVQLPSGILDGATAVLGNGVVVEPVKLWEEIRALERQGWSGDLRISELAHVVLPYHPLLDEARERWRGTQLATAAGTGMETGSGQLGSTKRGVGPCREDKIARIGLRLVDLLDGELVRERLSRLVPLRRKILAEAYGLGDDELAPLDDVPAMCQRLHETARALEPFMCDASRLLEQARAEGKRILYEGCQSVGLDIEHGTYPYVSSGYSSATGMPVGTGSPVSRDVRVLGVAKAYTVTVGGGPLPTEAPDDVADYLVERGREYGTVTGRRRRVGWLDLAFLRKAVRIDGIADLAVTGLDVIAGLDEVRVATHYALDGRRLEEYPPDNRTASRVQPVYTSLPGWPDTDWAAVRAPGDLPAPARAYAEWIARELGVRLVAAGVGPDRSDLVVWAWPWDAAREAVAQ